MPALLDGPTGPVPTRRDTLHAERTKILNECQVNQLLHTDAGTANRTWVNPDAVAAGVDNGMGNRWVNPDAVPARQHPQIKPT